MSFNAENHLFLSHPLLLEHGHLTHPENAERLQAIFDAFDQSPFHSLLTTSITRKASRKEIAMIHDQNYIDHVFSFDGKEGCLDVETPLTIKSVEAALLAVGLGLELVEQIVAGKIKNGFALLRPPGHHARPMAGMGFCLFNAIAISAKRAFELGVKKILILDFDVHHGNGTQEAFYEDNRLLFIDIHQENLFPIDSGLLTEIGKGKGEGYTVNIPLPPGCKDNDYLAIIGKIVTPLFLDYQPELVLVSAGFDAHESDPLGFMNLTTHGFGQITAKIKALTHQVGHEKIAFFLEGGYNPYFLAKNVMACVESLVMDQPQQKNRDQILPTEQLKQLIEKYDEFHLRQKRRTS